MKYEFTLNKDKLFELNTSNNVKAYFSTVHDGVSTGNYSSLNLALHVDDNEENVIENRHIYASKINMNITNFVFTNQTHSDNFYQVSNSDKNKGTHTTSNAINDVDAIYTFEDNIVLNLFYADCTPIYFFSEVDNLIGIIHAGWQGTVKEITLKTLKHIIEFHNIDPNNLEVVVGPSIDVNNFEVQQDVIDKLKHTKLDYKSCIHKKNDLKFNLNVKKMNEIQAKSLNIKSITVSDIDTYDNDNLFSYRKNNITGRMCATIYQTSNK